MPSIGVTVAVVHDGNILLTKRNDFEVWCLPGGGVDDGESVAQAAVRETLEETGLRVELTGLVGMYSRLGGTPDVHAVLFTARPIGGRPRTQPGETLEVPYFARDEIPRELFFGHRRRILDALGGAGGGVAWVQRMTSSVERPVVRQELYRLRDESRLPRAQVYLQFIGPSRREDEIQEVGNNGTDGNG